MLSQEERAKRREARRALIAQARERIARGEKAAGYVSVTGRVLSPGNMMMLVCQGVPRGTVGGFRQWQAIGRSVKRGEHGATILFPIRRNPREAAHEDEEVIDRVHFGSVAVFHLAQTEEIEADGSVPLMATEEAKGLALAF